jgi:DNA-binding transcriptional LysR family regulator
VLTDAGEGLFQSCQKVLGTLDDYVVGARNLQSGPVGTLRVQTTSDYARCVLAPLILEFSQRHSGLRVHLSVMTDNCDAVEDGFDVIVASKKPALPGLVDQDLGGIAHVVCASPDYFRRFGRPKEPQDLRDHNCLSDLFSGRKVWPFKSGTRQLPIEVKGTLSSNSYAVLIPMAVQGHGIIRVPRHAIKTELADKSLETIFDDITLSPERVYAYFSKAKNLPAKTIDFIRFLQDAIVGAR